MLLRVLHRTVYSYDVPIFYVIQTLRLTPVPYEGLVVRHWRVSGNSRRALASLTDGLGNILHIHTIDRPHRETVITVEGEVETRRADGVVVGTPEPLPPSFFLRGTPLTAADDAIRTLAREAASGRDVIERLHGLMREIHLRLAYRTGHTDSATTAAGALAKGSGVCQDHAHLFIAAARSIAIPARYVSGYLWTGKNEQEHEASHAWAEAFVQGLGWVGFDPANGICPAENYIRVAVGLDYWAAAPVRGIRRGRASEALGVKVQVQRPGADQ